MTARRREIVAHQPSPPRNDEDVSLSNKVNLMGYLWALNEEIAIWEKTSDNDSNEKIGEIDRIQWGATCQCILESMQCEGIRDVCEDDQALKNLSKIVGAIRKGVLGTMIKGVIVYCTQVDGSVRKTLMEATEELASIWGC